MRLESLENVEVLNSLPEATSTEYSRASLVDKNGEILYKFLYNPQDLKLSKSVAYSEVPIGGTAIQPNFYNHTKGSTLVLDNLLFDTYCEGRSSRELIEGLGRLTLPESANKQPKIINFVFGSFVFGPSIITNLDWTITSFIGGEPAVGSINLTLKETVGEKLPPTFSTVSSAGATTANSPTTTTTQPTDREVANIKNLVNQWLATNLPTQTLEVQDAFRSRNLTVDVKSYDQISLLIGSRIYQENAFVYNRQTRTINNNRG